MPFCVNCGQEIKEGAKFCTNCGQPVAPRNSGNAKRRIVYEGKIYKCPNCGETLSSFVANCPSCGYELRGNAAADSIQEFYRELNNTTSSSQKDDMIRNFPIPNSKEDILEFMILASTNILGEDNRDIYEAWRAKFEQAYQKAVLLFKTDEDFSKIQRIYENCQDNIESEKHRKINKWTIDTVIRNIAVCVGLLLMIIAVIMDRAHGNGIIMETVAYIVLIASAASLFKRDATIIDYVVGAVSGVMVILLSHLLNNGSMGEICGPIILIIVAVNYFKSLRNHRGDGE